MAAGFKTATVNAASVPATQTNFPAYVDLSRLGITTLAEAQSVRVYAESSKTTEWAREIVSATEMHVKVPSLTSTTSMYVDWDGVRADYAVTDTYGRNAVWSGYASVWHGDGLTDSKAGTNNLTLTGAGSYASGKLGNAFTTSARDQYWRTSSTPTGLPTGKPNMSVSFWVYFNGTPTGYNMPVTFGTDTNNLGYFAPNTGPNAGRMATFWAGGTGYGYIEPTSGTFTRPDDTWIYIHTTYDTTTHTFYANGVNVGSVGYTSSNLATNYFNICKHIAVTTNGLIGAVDEVRVLNGTANSANWITTEYNNQSDESGFWGTWSDVGGGGGGNTSDFFIMA